MAGGKKLPELEALTMAYTPCSRARPVSIWPQYFQSEAPAAMIAAVSAVVHKNLSRRTLLTCSRRSGEGLGNGEIAIANSD